MKWPFYRLLIGIGIVAQFGVLGAMIVRRELALKHGVACRFRTAPVDPYDAFRGKYVALNIEGTRDLITEKRYNRNQRVYVRLDTDTNGFSVIKGVEAKPDATSFWIKARVNYSYEEFKQSSSVTNSVIKSTEKRSATRQMPTGKFKTSLRMPFDRYYMDEKLAPEAEKAYREASRRKKHEAVVTVRVWRGLTVIERLEIDGKPIQDLARERLVK